MRALISSLVVLLSTTTVVGCGQTPSASSPTEKWNAINDPMQLSSSYERSWSALPLAGSLRAMPWVDSYWPSSKGGLAFRWNTDQPDGFDYRTLSKKKARKLDPDAIAALSPAEKFDIFRGRYDFPLVASERRRTSPDLPSWEGLCHGWAPAAMLFQEPAPVTLTNDDGIAVPFGASDIKALILYVQGTADVEARTLGSRCEYEAKDRNKFRKDPACADTNAGAFHLVLANQIGLMNEGFVADVTREAEVWNHPVYAFTSNVSGERAPAAGAAPGTVRELLIETSMSYAIEIDAQWDKADLASATKTYKYSLELDSQGKVIGGAWLSQDRPDFLWTQGAAALDGEFAPLQALYEAATSAL